MKKLNIKTIVLYCVVTLFSVVTISSAQNTKDEIKIRMKDRFAQISELKQSGKIGETPLGFAEAVNKEFAQDEEISTLITAENNDRSLLYAIIAKESQTSVEEVGMGNAKRYFQKASDLDYFKTQAGGMEAEKGYDTSKTLRGALEALVLTQLIILIEFRALLRICQPIHC